jgi:hypothetical protein
MAKTTTLTIESPIEGRGFASLVSGQQAGESTRQVSIQAYPAQGYVFDRWEVVTQPATLPVFDAVASRPVSSLGEVCGTSGDIGGVSYQNVAVQLFTDGRALYLDDLGNTLAPTGYWGAGGGTYYLWDGGRLPTLQQCSTGTGGGGGGSGGGDSIGLIEEDGSTFGSTGGRDDIRFT